MRKNHNFGCMDNIQFWLYVIIAVIALIAQMRKKRQQQTEQEKPRPARREAAPRTTVRRTVSTTSSPAKPVSFEDLLREIIEAKEPQPVEEAKPAFGYEAEVEDYDYYKEDETLKIYEKAKQEAFNRASLEETSSLDDTKVSYEHFRNYEISSPTSRAGAIANEIKRPEGLKKAVILSEILNRKHF